MTRKLTFYPILRTYHLTRRVHGTEHFRYLGSSYDFDPAEAVPGRDLRRTTWRGVLRDAWRLDVDVVEVPEPLWLKYAPLSVSVAAVARLRARLRRRDPGVRVTTYAIENNALDDRYLDFAHRVPLALRRWAVRAVLRLAARTVTRVAYGSPDAREAYRRAAGGEWVRDQRTVLELPGVPTSAPIAKPREHGEVVTFVGELHVRKGLDTLLAAWPAVLRRVPGARLEIVGDGPLAEQVRTAAAASGGDVVAHGRLTAREVRAVLDRTCVAVQPSRADRRWREQIGLPIEEALGQGCRVVTTPETGLHDWIEAQAEGTIVHDPGPEELADAVVAALHRPHPHLAWPLPDQEGYAAAVAWLDDVANPVEP